jgi:hypothetical protein
MKENPMQRKSGGFLRNITPLYLISFFAVSLVSLNNNPAKIKFGYYSSTTGGGQHSITLYQDSTFLADSRSCTYAYEEKGFWKVKADTLIAIATQERKSRISEQFEACKPDTQLYLIKGNTLCFLERHEDQSLYISETLIFTDTTKAPKRKKY